jgi:hypothetical protein
MIFCLSLLQDIVDAYLNNLVYTPFLNAYNDNDSKDYIDDEEVISNICCYGSVNIQINTSQ